MAAVTAARWDVEWDRGGAWWVRLGRRTPTGTPVPVTDPCAMELREVDAPSSTPAIMTVVGTLTTLADGTYIDLMRTREEIESLPGKRYEHRVVVTDAARATPLVLLRGYVSIADGVEDMD
jgi:hypothetical protein